ncbi:hypothetical protein Glove_709g38 [Diversispora epigaea]|uniref:VWFA domain-containing protein n=1 Tax=Diversispora epigaea TaxID=1348612 RepID=A0A397G188_9GLOM|nr:hypothetical protein Glove_709g38 [Diversispora epigaea]
MQIRGQDHVDVPDVQEETTDPNNSVDQENSSPQDLNQSTSTAPPELSDPSLPNQENLDNLNSQILNQNMAASYPGYQNIHDNSASQNSNPSTTPGYPGGNDLQDIHGNISSTPSTLRNFKGNEQDGNRSSAPRNSNQSTAAGYPGGYYQYTQGNRPSSLTNQGNLNSNPSSAPGYIKDDDQDVHSSVPPESIYSSAPQNQNVTGYPPVYDQNQSTATGYPHQDIPGYPHQDIPGYPHQDIPGYPHQDILGNRFPVPPELKYSNASSFVNQVNLDPQNVNKSTSTGHSRDYNQDTQKNRSNAPSKLKKSSASSPEANIIPQQTPSRTKDLFPEPPGQFLPDNKPSTRRERNRSSNSKVRNHSNKQKRVIPVDSPLENKINFDAFRNQTNFDAPPRNQTNFDAPPGNQTNFDAFPRNQTNFNAPLRNQTNFDAPPRNQINFDVPINQTNFDASPRNQSNFDAPGNQTSFDALRNKTNFGAPPRNQTNSDASPRNQTNFDAPSRNQTNFGAPPRNQTNFDAPSRNQTNFGAPPRNQTNFSAPRYQTNSDASPRNQTNSGFSPRNRTNFEAFPANFDGNQTNFKPFPENQTNFEAFPANFDGSQTNFNPFPENQTNFGAFPENQKNFNNFDAFSENQFSFDNPTHNFHEQTDQPMDLPNFSQFMNDNIFSNNKSGESPNLNPNFFMNENMSTPENFSSSSFGGPSRSTYSDQESDASDDFELSSQKNHHKHILSVITKHKYYHAGSRINIDHEDLVEYIPGMYRLLDLYKDDGSNGLVDKIIISKDSLKKLCNELVPYSFNSISEINYNRLNLITFRLIGCYGNHELISKLLLNKRIINKQVFDCLTSKETSTFESRNKSSLRPGIYLLIINPEVGLVIYWPEPGSYEENAHSQRKKNMTNMHRYLTKLTDHQFCFMSDKDLECFEWKSDIESQNSDDDDSRTFEFEVKKNQEEQEDFKLHKGFEVNLPRGVKNLVKREHKNIPLSPMVVESTHKQAFITREIIESSATMERRAFTVQFSTLYTELKKRLQDKALRISHDISMDNLKILIINGLKMEEKLLGPTNLAIEMAKKENHSKKQREQDALKNDGKLIEEKAYKLVRCLYRPFEYKFLSNPSDQSDSLDENDENSINLKQFDNNYPGMSKNLQQCAQINSQYWIKLKRRFFYAKILLAYLIYGDKSESPKKIEKFVYEAFFEVIESQENDPLKLYNAFTKIIERETSSFFSYFSFNKLRSFFTFNNATVNELYERAIRFENNTSDDKLIHGLLNDKFFGKNDDIEQRTINLFYVAYSNWRLNMFPGNVKKIIPQFSDRIKKISSKFDEELNLEKGRILEKELKRIIKQIESMYPTGRIFKIIGIRETSTFSYRGQCAITYEEETSLPDQLKVTIYETSLDQSDNFNSQMNDLYIPKPSLSYGSSSYHGNLGVSFQINPEVYDLRKIFQFENKKFFVILWNKKQGRIEFYYESASSLNSVIQPNTSKIFKSLNTSENCYFAVNEPKGLIGIYNKDDGELNVYAFDEEKKNLFNRNSNISVRQWYNGIAPDIQHFFFIQDTEELCLIENGGKAKLFNLVTNQFRPSVGQIPVNTIDVTSTPDGACIVAFVKEKVSARTTENTENYDTELSSDEENEENEKVILRAYVYFCSNFGQEASKIIDLPEEFQNLECLQFSFMNKHQMHLISLDFEKRLFYSSIVKITLEKTQYRFQQRIKKNPLGRVKLMSAKNHYSLIKGNNTHFKRDIKISENIVLMGERYSVLEIISDTELKIAGNFQPKIESTWIDFQIEPKTKLNGFIETYRLMYEKYPIDGCVDGDQVRPLSLRVILDISDEDEIEKHQENFEEYITEMFDELRRTTKKPATMLKKFKTVVSTFNSLDIEDPKFLKKNSREFQLGEWIIQLSCLIPIQIAVARNNQLLPLRDGLSATEIDQFDFVSGCGNHVDNIAQNISFGWYEGIFKHFGSRKVKVVSSMGEQSCGKSYMLNHLVGTTFDGSAMRCTEGAWMSLAVTPEYIYVALDFEGLRSLERTPQEDLFLTLLNTVVSNLILFKNQFSINRDMSLMFQRFQDGALLLNDPKLFQAKLCIIIKDVPSQDKDDIVREFTLRFNTLVAQEGEDNFITKMYPSGLVILPWALFSDAAWYKNLKDVKKMLDKQEARYENARTFLQNIKVIMAKLKICDWGSLDENLIQIRVANLRRFIQTAISLGIEQKDPIKEPLRNYDTGLEIENHTISISDIIEDYDQSTELLHDPDLLLYDEDPDFLDLSKDLRLYFEEKIQPRVESTNDSEWFDNFEKFIKYITERRIHRVQEWFSQNVSKFPQDNSDIVIGRYSLEQEISKFSLFWTLCGLTCQNCNLKCLKNRDHADGQHDCLTDHECHANCQFTEAHLNRGLIPQCSYKAAHSGKHACDKASHLCGEPCKLSSRRNCQKKCSKDIGHEDGNHLCQANLHYCGEPCSLSTITQKGDYKCPNQCIIPCEDEHDSHHCENNSACPIQCPIPDCQRRCQSDDHFHAFSEPMVNHFCGQEHQCQKDCEEPGVCKVQVEPKKQEDVYQGLVSRITFIRHIQVKEILKCKIKIPPNSFEHDGKHSHDENSSVHFCDVQCKYCEYYCTLPYGHTQPLHETSHGNMIQTVFTSDDDKTFEYGGHKLKSGDHGTFIMCNLHCKDAGRHRHIDYCQNGSNCKNEKNLQHIQGKVHPDPDKPKDYISHRLFWERSGFKEPYSAKEQEEFAKCDHECNDKKHSDPDASTGTPTKSYCQKEIFHDPVDSTAPPPGNCGYVSLDGHHFHCDNPVTREATFHIVLVLDRSSSMSYSDKKPVANSPVYQKLIQNHNNRTGAVYSAIYSFLETRINTVKANTPSNVAAAPKDTVSLILFDHTSEIIFENKKLDNSDYCMQEMLKHVARGGTDFDRAIQKAGTVIDNHFDPLKTNIIIFCSDGECGVPEGQLRQICSRNKQKGSPLYLYTILFSGDVNSPSLSKMAEIAKSYHPAASSGSLKCQFSQIITEVNLVDHLTGVAESLRRHKPALLRKSG